MEPSSSSKLCGRLLLPLLILRRRRRRGNAAIIPFAQKSLPTPQAVSASSGKQEERKEIEERERERGAEISFCNFLPLLSLFLLPSLCGQRGTRGGNCPTVAVWLDLTASSDGRKDEWCPPDTRARDRGRSVGRPASVPPSGGHRL